ncbi:MULTISPECIES: toprim domain-containing protein [Mucilaginibacter]|nr:MULTISPECIES: toprim domain-containing protein [Mucilaginibacter]QTE45951.1 toprim domain-containing protein [Mucilaginibacter rubeus]QTE52548.1 toprim domain-containing protein [Mucilaginibacter rubeus]QTE57637.1 toprim domain-containing protein [Mucilaginibacter rubeus]QTE62902.1 toprim domain-containing protein [Mucilaginibacter rubeus]QTF61660.1 toprim domain-containing protein [Mucilaginibacter rubeus]
MENQQLKAKEIKENYSLVDLLTHLGYEPVKRVRNEQLYLSMLRDSDTTPSFSVNDKQGTWFDFGEGKGGNIIDFGLQYWKGLPFPEILEKIVLTCGGLVPVLAPQVYKRQPSAEKEPNYEILDIKDLGSNAAILNYLESRGVGQVAEGRLKEIYYYVEDEDKKRNKFFAAGWQNEQGAWEIRNLNFKGCLGHKAISFIPNSEKKLAVFEGFFNYLSWLTENPFAPDSVLVLNSLSLLQAGILKAQDFRDISLFLDNDPSGRQATLDFTSALPWAKDRAGIYTGYNDYNDLIVAGRTNYQLNR